MKTAQQAVAEKNAAEGKVPVEQTVTPTNPAAPVPEPVEKVEPQDLNQRMAQYKPVKDNEPTPAPADDSFKLNLETIAKIEDPTLREKAMNTYKSMESGMQEKFREIATMRKELETQSQSMNSFDRAWMEKHVNDPAFIQAAVEYQNSLSPNSGIVSDEDWSLMDDASKNRFNEQQRQIDDQKITLQKIQSDTQRTQYLSEINSQHDNLSTKYGAYDRDGVQGLMENLSTGKYQASVEDIWKSYDYDKMANRIYKMGREDERNGIQEKIQSNTSVPVSTTITPTEEIAIKEGEDSKSFFLRRAMTRLAESKGRK